VHSIERKEERNTEELREGGKGKGKGRPWEEEKKRCHEHSRKDGKERDEEGNINRHTSASRIQRSTRRWKLRRENGRRADEDFEPSELTVKTLYGEGTDGLEKIEEEEEGWKQRETRM